ncbi:RNA polymerase sigma factor [Kordiimonas aquimaris]|uniref:RNA polymerase sigma factor n=1 Tax=Kordiimonas aquimaris TaxID=707591 RepID=UPI0021D293F0|nr:sigma-70 family RNA polymerase sigma factor [Kordiimonas aquimaris]
MMSTQAKADRNLHLKTLMVKVQNGNEVAFSELYTETSPLLFSIALRLMPTRQLAEEVLQEAYVTAWQKAEKFQSDKGTVLTWLATITRNLSIDYLRKKQLNTVPEDEGIHVETADPSPFQEIANNEAQNVLMAGIENLPENMKKAVTLSYFKGYSYDEIGELMNAPRNTVKSWIRRGVAKLRETILIPAEHLL